MATTTKATTATGTPTFYALYATKMAHIGGVGITPSTRDGVFVFLRCPNGATVWIRRDEGGEETIDIAPGAGVWVSQGYLIFERKGKE